MILKITITPFELAQRFVGLAEAPGVASNPSVLGMLRLDAAWPSGDDVPWCSAFANYITWLLRLPRSKSLAARSWLDIGKSVPLAQAEVGFDVVVLARGGGMQPGADVRDAPGHVGFFAGMDESTGMVRVLGGNQGDAVTVASFPAAAVLGVRRLV